MFTYTTVRSVKETQRKRGMEGSLVNFPAHTKESQEDNVGNVHLNRF